MKSINKIIFGATGLLMAGIAMVSCTKSFDSRLVSTYGNTASSNVQLFIATVGASRNYLVVDNKPVNGAALASGSLFPSVGFGFSVPTGMRSFLLRDTLTATTQTAISFAQNMEIGKSYTIFSYDTITATKQKTVETPIVIPADTTSRLRFANFIYNPNAISGVDVFSFNRNTNLFTNVNVTDVTSFVPYPSALLTDTLYIRPTGNTTTNLVKVTVTGGLTQKRSYTLVYRGSDRGTRTASLIANY
jgi:hypothetical protein